MLRRSTAQDAPAIAALFRLVRRTCLPYLPDLHTPAEDLVFFRDHILTTREVWCAGDAEINGFIAFGDGWIDHLYVHPARHKAGIGTALLALAQTSERSLQLWVFQRNLAAIRFYRARDFHLVEETDGARNEEREPDARFAWRAPP